MDIKMDAESITATAHPVWDVKVEKGIVPMITGDEEDLQTATLAGFIEKGSIPLLPDAGVSWSDYLTKEITFGELDAEVRGSISEAGKDNFYPDYEIENDQLVMTIGKVEE
jgi:hypothetical protein